MSTTTAAAPVRLKDRYWFKTLKWHLYKRHFGDASWSARYLFDGLVRRLTADDLVIDCGANLGEFTQQLAASGATVHAFEPDPYTFGRLVENTSRFPNVVCHNQAVGVGTGTVKLYRTAAFDANPEAASISSSLLADKVNIDQSNFVEVELIDFVSFVRSLPRMVKLLKMDIEGAEVDVLEHLLASGAVDCCEQIFAETHEDRIPALAQRTAALRQLASGEYSQKLHLDWH